MFLISDFPGAGASGGPLSVLNRKTRPHRAGNPRPPRVRASGGGDHPDGGSRDGPASSLPTLSTPVCEVNSLVLPRSDATRRKTLFKKVEDRLRGSLDGRNPTLCPSSQIFRKKGTQVLTMKPTHPNPKRRNPKATTPPCRAREGCRPGSGGTLLAVAVLVLVFTYDQSGRREGPARTSKKATRFAAGEGVGRGTSGIQDGACQPACQQPRPWRDRAAHRRHLRGVIFEDWDRANEYYGMGPAGSTRGCRPTKGVQERMEKGARVGRGKRGRRGPSPPLLRWRARAGLLAPPGRRHGGTGGGRAFKGATFHAGEVGPYRAQVERQRRGAGCDEQGRRDAGDRGHGRGGHADPPPRWTRDCSAPPDFAERVYDFEENAAVGTLPGASEARAGHGVERGRPRSITTTTKRSFPIWRAWASRVVKAPSARGCPKKALDALRSGAPFGDVRHELFGGTRRRAGPKGVLGMVNRGIGPDPGGLAISPEVRQEPSGIETPADVDGRGRPWGDSFLRVPHTHEVSAPRPDARRGARARSSRCCAGRLRRSHRRNLAEDLRKPLQARYRAESGGTLWWPTRRPLAGARARRNCHIGFGQIAGRPPEPTATLEAK